MARKRIVRKRQSTAQRPSSTRHPELCRVVVTVCSRERGVVTLPVERGGRRRRLDAEGVQKALREIVAARGIDRYVSILEGCAGGCGRPGPNVDVRLHSTSSPGGTLDSVAIGWKTYVYSLASLPCVASIIEDNLYRRAEDDGLE